MKTVIVLAMHGVPPRDFPRDELIEFMGLHSRLDYAGSLPPQMVERHEALDKKIREWPRTNKNDQFYGASKELADHISKNTGHDVIVGFSEFCGPGLDEAFDHAAAGGASRILVITPMMTRGGDHAESDIPEAIRRAQGRHPSIEFAYVWPFSASRVAKFLSSQLRTYL